MGIDRKYGQVSTEHGEIPDDEPVVVIRARDKNAVKTLNRYWRFCSEGGSPQRHLDIISATIDDFEKWQDEHPDQVRTPDSERSRAWLGEESPQ